MGFWLGIEPESVMSLEQLADGVVKVHDGMVWMLPGVHVRCGMHKQLQVEVGVGKYLSFD